MNHSGDSGRPEMVDDNDMLGAVEMTATEENKDKYGPDATPADDIVTAHLGRN
ncbi:hypothetical protein [Streptomyces sp. NPDC005209]|uniref:hypothetical protein n=1 Tax=Streptomyces sp. NPDC005209 TaxID=3156715 RepID=UPI0033AD23A1